MSAFLNQRLTNAGWDALSTALGGGRLTFFKLQAGSGTIANDDAILGMTALVSPVCDCAITKYTIEGDGQITLWANIASAQLDVGFTFRELGVFATIEAPVAGLGGVPSGPNIQVAPPLAQTASNPVVPTPPAGTALMYSYCNSYANSDYIPGKGETSDVVNTVQVTIKIDEVQPVINIVAGQTFDVTNIGAPSVGAGPWSYTQANVGYFKRLVAGPATNITEDANTITIGQKQLLTDLDLYVANGNPDISPNFSSVQKALNYLGQFVIPTTIRARINVSPGTYTSTTAIVVDHPNSQSITIQGPQNNTVSGTSISIAGSASAWNMTINGITDTSQFVANYWAIINSVIGVTSNNHAMVCGCFKVLSKTANSVTVRVPNPKASFSVTGVTAIQITPLSVILTNSLVNAGVVSIGSAGIRLFQYIAIIPTVAPTAAMGPFYVSGTAYLKFVGVAMWYSIMNAQGTNGSQAIYAGATCTCESCATTYNQNGFTASGNGYYAMRGCASTYNSLRNIWIDGGAGCTFFSEPTFIAAAGEIGIIIADGAQGGVVAGIPQGYVFCQKNDGIGLAVINNGSFVFSNSYCTLWLVDNNLSQATHYDVTVQNFGLVGGSVCIVGTRIFGSAVGVMTSSGGLIN